MRHSMIFAIRLALVVSSLFVLAHTGRAAPPARYDVQLRYRINASRNQRIAQFLAMTRDLESLGFKKNPGEESEAEDPTETRMTGSIDAANARKLLYEPHVKALLLLPAGYALPQDAKATVKLQLDLASGLPADRQRSLEDQVRVRLAPLGFREAIGYDHRGHTRLVGWIPRGELDTLLGDLRWQSSGALAPAAPVATLPSPIKNVSPVLVTEVIPESADKAPGSEAPPPVTPPEDDLQSLKVSREIRELASGKSQTTPLRMEVILTTMPRPGDSAWENELSRAAGGLVIEGRLGSVVSVIAAPGSAVNLARLPSVSTIRLPRGASSASLESPEGQAPWDVLRATGLDRLHARAARGQGIRLAIIDGDFRGYQRFLGRGLPRETRYIDLTAERNPSLEPDPFPGPADAIGHGTACALVASLAAPDARLTLIRVDPTTPYQVRDVAGYVYGEPVRSYSAAQRSADLLADTDRLRAQREALGRERRAFLESFGQGADVGRRREAMLKEREEVEKELRERGQSLSQREAELSAQELAHRTRQERFLRLERDLFDLRGTQVVTSSLLWNDGYPLGGNGVSTSYFDNQPPHDVFWFQAAGNTRGQSWSGLYRDVDGNGVMEFAAPDEAVKPGRWTRELNFLAWQSGESQPGPELPAKTKLHLSLQWTEAHDPSFAAHGEDLYVRPLADLRLLVLRQRVPSGSTVAGDDMELVATSVGLPERLANDPSSATYEQRLDLPIDSAGRYAVRIEGRVPRGIRPPGTPTFPAIEEFWELRPRLFVNATEAGKRGRVVLLDYATGAGSLGMPAESRMLVTVGAADQEGRPEPWSTMGPPLNRGLLTKPNILAYDSVPLPGTIDIRALGTSISAAFAGGTTASLLSAGMPPGYLEHAFAAPSIKLLTVPRGFLSAVRSPKPAPRDPAE
jgi:hypothetical protein